LSPGSVFEGFDAAEIDGVSLYEIRVELMLADHLAELVADRSPARPIAAGRLGRESRRLLVRLVELGTGTKFFD